MSLIDTCRPFSSSQISATASIDLLIAKDPFFKDSREFAFNFEFEPKMVNMSSNNYILSSNNCKFNFTQEGVYLNMFEPNLYSIQITENNLTLDCSIFNLTNNSLVCRIDLGLKCPSFSEMMITVGFENQRLLEPKLLTLFNHEEILSLAKRRNGQNNLIIVIALMTFCFWDL